MREDPDVALFAKILKNECEEQFRLVHEHIKNAVNGMIRTLLCERRKHISETELRKQVDKIKNGNIEESMWRKVVERMYHDKDARRIAKLLST